VPAGKKMRLRTANGAEARLRNFERSATPVVDAVGHHYGRGNYEE